MNARLAIVETADERLERQIQTAYDRWLYRPTREGWNDLTLMIKQRSDTQVRRMEKRLGL